MERGDYFIRLQVKGVFIIGPGLGPGPGVILLYHALTKLLYRLTPVLKVSQRPDIYV